MGMGEPMHNLEAVLPSVDILCQPLGMHFSYNKVRWACGCGMAATLLKRGDDYDGRLGCTRVQ
jgi:adenine C2-methylase RlmN of 23S rRNA A2503 and tRNA A37